MTEIEEKSPFEEIGEYIEKEALIEELFEDPEAVSIILDKLEKLGIL